MEKRFKNYGLWLAVFAFIPVVAEALGYYGFPFGLPENYKEVYVGILSILVMAGIINDPNTENHGYKDE